MTGVRLSPLAHGVTLGDRDGFDCMTDVSSGIVAAVNRLADTVDALRVDQAALREAVIETRGEVKAVQAAYLAQSSEIQAIKNAAASEVTARQQILNTLVSHMISQQTLNKVFGVLLTIMTTAMVGFGVWLVQQQILQGRHQRGSGAQTTFIN